MVSSAIAAAAIAVVLVIWVWHHRLRGTICRIAPQHPLESYPSVTLICPTRGYDVGADENVAAKLHQEYPGDLEILFVFDDEGDLGLPPVRAALEQPGPHRGRARVIFAGEPPQGRTGKLNAMIAGLEQAQGELVAFVDSDTRPAPQTLRALVETLSHADKAGSVFAPVVVAEEPKTLGDAGYALLLNALYGTVACAASERHGGELPFIMGQFMVFRREAIRAIGGLEDAQGQLVDDMYIGARVRKAGYRNVMASHPVPIVQQDLPLKQFVALYRRWMTFSRSGLPGWSFKGMPLMHGIAFWLGLVGACLTALVGWWLAALALVLVPTAVCVSITRLHTAFGGARLERWHLPSAFWLLLGAPFVFATIYMHHEVNWRGRSYKLDASSRLASDDGGEDPAREPSTAA